MQPWLFSHIQHYRGPAAWRDHSFFTNQCHLKIESIWHVSMWPKKLRTSNKTGVSKRGNFPAFCPAAMGTPKPSLKSLLRKGDLLVAPGVFDARLQFEVYQFCWPLMVQVQQKSINHGCILLYFGWVLLKLIDKLYRQDLYECAWCFMWGLANTFFCLEALIYKKHPSTSRSNPERQVTKTLLISTLHDRSYAFWLLISRCLTYSDHSYPVHQESLTSWFLFAMLQSSGSLTFFINKFCRSLQLLRMVFPHALLTRLSGLGWIRRIRRSVVMMMPLVRFKKAVKNGQYWARFAVRFLGVFFQNCPYL